MPTWAASSNECLAKADDDGSLYSCSLAETAKLLMYRSGYLLKGERDRGGEALLVAS
jgi:hypothetical protein